MPLIKSISGIRGTIGSKKNENLTPEDIKSFTAAFGEWVKSKTDNTLVKIVVGRDARKSGKMINSIVNNTLISLGINVIDLGLSTTPTVEMMVLSEKAQGGIVITASHNPKEWNALKFLNNKGECLSASSILDVINRSESININFSKINELGRVIKDNSAIDSHISSILNLSIINSKLIRNQKYKVVVDAVNSSGGIAIPKILSFFGIEVIKMNCEPDGNFSHDPEPLEKNLRDLAKEVIKQKADFGIAVDPDVDRLAFIDEKGCYFGEEYTLVACADYVLSKKSGNTVSNLSSTIALSDVTKRYNGTHYSSKVGEVNVVEEMKLRKAVIGGEGNGGVIYPDLHYGRDALIGVALFLSLIAERNIKVSQLKSTYPLYFMSKQKINLDSKINIESIFTSLKKKFNAFKIITIDGIKIYFKDSWIHLRKSNTESIIRIISEGKSKNIAEKIAKEFVEEINKKID
ncbi:MAG: phosphoglucosamine mutase [Flavobacteriaceae bacterium]|nr:phosphoglucosamine mutase [Flavobacteriaceae bacterium]|tara:strand:- start:9048 stop:10433 length:1386 start_codon:yes stop_codon:yes gene_type:complete